MVERLDGFEGVGAEKADEVEAVGREGVVELQSDLLTGEPANDPAVYLESPEHLADLGKLASIEVWQGVRRELVEALQ